MIPVVQKLVGLLGAEALKKAEILSVEPGRTLHVQVGHHFEEVVCITLLGCTDTQGDAVPPNYKIWFAIEATHPVRIFDGKFVDQWDGINTFQCLLNGKPMIEEMEAKLAPTQDQPGVL